MASVNSAVEICNLALDYLKEAPISSIETPQTDTETMLSRWYDHTRKAVLRKHPWNFAIKRAGLARLTSTPAFGYSFQYDLPSDFVRLLSIGTGGEIRSYELESNKILVNDNGYNASSSTVLNIRYIYNFTNVSKMDPLFVDVFAIELAMRISYQLTGSDTKIQTLVQMLRDIVPETYSIDGQERPPKKRNRSRLLNARRSMGSSVASPYTIFEE